MKLPYLQATQQSVDMVSQFGGLNKKLLAPENEFSDMLNMSAMQFPMVATREKRGHIRVNGNDTIDNAIGVHAKDRLLVTYLKESDTGVVFPDGLTAQTVDGVRQNDGVWTSFLGLENRDENALTFIEDYLRNVDDEVNGRIYFWQNNTNVGVSYYSTDTYNNGVYIKWSHPTLTASSQFGLLIGEIESVVYPYKNDANRIKVKIRDKSARNEYFYTWIESFGYDVRLDSSKSTYSKYSAFEGGSDEGGVLRSIVLSYDIHNDLFKFKKGAKVYAYINTSSRFMGIAEKNESNLYSYAKITANNEEEINRLRGNTLDYNGNKFKIVSVTKTANEYEYTAKIERPHEAIPKDFSPRENRLWLGEVNPETGEMISTNICPAASGKRHIVEMGAYLVVFPEKVRINTADRSLSGHYNSIENLEFTNKLVHGDASYSYRLVLHDGTVVDLDNKGVVSATSPTDPFDGQLWIDNTTMPYTFKRWSEQTCLWATFAPYCEFWGKGVSEEWAVGDAFEFDTVPNFIQPAEGQKYFVISEVGEKVDDNDISLGNFIRFPCSMTTARLCSSADGGKRILRRTVPDLDFVVESENRLWGCKYGEVDGEMVNEIFACKLGDPKNWHYFANVSIDSYYANLGAEGAFTGAITYNSNPFFFREDSFHRVFGNYPANYAVKTYKAHGVEEGSEHSLVIMNDVLYYKSPVGVMAYTGATPVNISENLGQQKLKDVCSGAVNNNMYLTMKDSEGVPSLFVYNDYYRLWHKEDNLEVKSFATWDNEIYALSADNKLYCLSGGYGDKEDALKWSFTSGTIGFSTPFRKSIFKINARLSMGFGARADVSIQYDSSGNWEHVANIRPTGKVGSVSIPIMPRRCDHFSLRFSGVGDVKLLSLVKYMEEGSDV